MRYFNTGGVCLPDIHYMLPPEPRLPDARRLVAQRAYFVVHAPRQTGKTTSLQALCRNLTAEGEYTALHFSCEGAQAYTDDPANAERVVWNNITQEAEDQLPPELRPAPSPAESTPGIWLQARLSDWSRACPRPLVLVFDEIDTLRGRALSTVLRQLRAGHPKRGPAFPSSVILCGLRDVRDYKAASGGAEVRLGSPSPFNVLVKSMSLGNFTCSEVSALYHQHTADTGQPFTPAAVDRACALTGGQPWLINALAREIIEKMRVPASKPITADHIDRAKERLILARATHLDSLVDKLNEGRVRRVIAPLITGRYADVAGGYDDDLEYVRDLGLVHRRPPVQVANPIYREIIVRVLASPAEQQLPTPPTRSFVLPDGRLDLRRVLEEFAAFWREHGDILANGMSYHEVAAQLVIMAWFQRIVNGGGYVDREYGIGRGRIDLLLRWPYQGPDGERLWQREAIELKVRTERRPDPLDRGLSQLDGYLDRTGLDTGVLVIFDRRADAPVIAERTVFESANTPSGRPVTVLRG